MRNVTSSCTSYSTCFGPFFFFSFFLFFFFLLFEDEEGQVLLTQLGGPSPAWL